MDALMSEDHGKLSDVQLVRECVRQIDPRPQPTDGEGGSRQATNDVNDSWLHARRPRRAPEPITRHRLRTLEQGERPVRRAPAPVPIPAPIQESRSEKQMKETVHGLEERAQCDQTQLAQVIYAEDESAEATVEMVSKEWAEREYNQETKREQNDAPVPSFA